MFSGQNGEYSLAALSMAAEYQLAHGASSYSELPSSVATQELDVIRAAEQQSEPPAASHVHDAGLGESLDSLDAFLDNEPLAAYQFSSLINFEQPMLFLLAGIVQLWSCHLILRKPSSSSNRSYLSAYLQ